MGKRILLNKTALPLMKPRHCPLPLFITSRVIKAERNETNLNEAVYTVPSTYCELDNDISYL